VRMQMNKLFASVLIVAGLGISAGAAQAMPFAADRAQGSLLALVAGGCGIGWHRSPWGGCSRNAYGLFGMGFYYVPKPYYPSGSYYGGPVPCDGRGVHNACNIFGQCWSVCN
jgi:hypothetical protein